MNCCRILLVLFVTAVVTVVFLFSPQPDLTAYPVSAPAPIVVKVGADVRFSADIKNVGNWGTDSPFSCFFQVWDFENGEGPEAFTDLHHINTPRLGRKKTRTVAFTHAFDNPGTYRVRLCADKTDRASFGPASGALIAESNEDNNCSMWVLVRVVQ